VTTARLRTMLTLLAGFGLVLTLLILPAPRRGSDSAAATPPGPPTLASVWPNAHPFPIAATFPDGSSFYPLVIVDPNTVLGLAGSPDGRRSDLVVAGPTGAPRLLEPTVVESGERVGPYAVSDDQFLWIRGVTDDNGQLHFSLWAADRSGGPAHQLSTDVGEPVENNSAYDMQIVGDRLYWVSNDTAGYQLRSIELHGGPVDVKPLPGQWGMLAWPWMMTGPATTPPALWNMTTGEHRPVTVPPGQIVFCSLQWCRVSANNVANANNTVLLRPDGTDRQILGGMDTIAIGNDVATLDRFEPLIIPQVDTMNITIDTVLLYDITHRRTVRIEAAATDAYSLGPYLWWSTGDNETTAWYGLDLRTLA